MDVDRLIVNTLQHLSKERPWMTARGIKLRINRLYRADLTIDDISDELVALESLEESKIRRSKFPSKKTLEELWGHVTNVGEKEVPPSDKTNHVDLFFEDEIAKLDIEAPMCFLSHSHKDEEAVVRVGKEVAGLGIYPWTAETEIAFGDHINNSIREALEKSKYFVVLISRNALASRWTGKEFIGAYMRFDKVILLFDTSDNGQMILDILDNRDSTEPKFAPDQPQPPKAEGQFAPQIREKLADAKTVICLDGEITNPDERLKPIKASAVPLAKALKS